MRTYTLDPYGLVNKAGVWYLVADHDGEARLFRTDRTQSASVLPEPARRRPGLELADVWDALRRVIDDAPTELAVTARVRDGIMAMFRRLHAPDLVGESVADNGWTTVELRFRADLAAQALLAFGPDVEVVAPQRIREMIADCAAATVARYAGTTEGSTSVGS